MRKKSGESGNWSCWHCTLQQTTLAFVVLILVGNQFRCENNSPSEHSRQIIDVSPEQ